MVYEPPSLARLIQWLADADEARRELLLGEFMEAYTYAATDLAAKAAVCGDEPDLTGDPH